MTTPEQFFEQAEIQFAADDLATAADEATLLADADLRADVAQTAAREADTPIEIFRAELELQRACLDAIHTMAKGSRAAWELQRLLDQ